MRRAAIAWAVVLIAAHAGVPGRARDRPARLKPDATTSLAAPAQTQTAPTRSRLTEAPQDIKRLAILAVEDARAPARDDIRVLLLAARSENHEIQTAAVRALGRLERRDVIPDLLQYLRAESSSVRDEAANAVAQAFRGEPLQVGVPAGQQVQAAAAVLFAAPKGDGVYRSIGRLPYETADQMRAAEHVLLTGLPRPAPSLGAARGLESLARLSRTLGSLEEETLERLRVIASRSERTYGAVLRQNAMEALVAAQGVDLDTLGTTINDEEPEIRRLAALSLIGAASPLEQERRLDIIDTALDDRSPMVRIEAVKAYARRAAADRGCLPLLNALADPSPHVMLAAMDALGDQCPGDVVVTDRLISELRTPPPLGPWQREAHALVAMAKRAPDRAAIAMSTFGTHLIWQVRMYAARAAAVMNDTEWLERLAFDANDNVREATLQPLRKRLGAASDRVFLAALERTDYQLLRTAARELKGAEPGETLANALAGALTRTTSDRSETSRDTRLALLERLAELGSVDQAASLRPLLRDFDPKVAVAAGNILREWTGVDQRIEPQPLPRAPLPTESELAENIKARITMDSGQEFDLEFLTDQAPLARTKFVRLAREKYYDGLTFHRVVPNAFIQGGSPGANEYRGHPLYMHDEVGLAMHMRGTVGISTRGRDTGDAQIFINLVDNPYLDHQYTVFARVCSGMAVVDNIVEGDRITRIRIEKVGKQRGCD